MIQNERKKGKEKKNMRCTLQMCSFLINAYYVSFCHPVDSMIQFDLMSMDLDLNPIHFLALFYGNVVADFLNSVQK